MATRPASTRTERERMRAALVGLRARPGWLDRVLRLVVRAGFALVGWRIRASGYDRLPRDAAGQVAPCVVAVAPHRGWVDPFLLLLTWPRDAPRLAWFGDARTMTRSGWRRALLPRLGMIPIPPEVTPAAVRGHLADARLVLGRGCCLVVFPEKGPPSAPGTTRTIAPGAAWLAAAAGAPLVPVAIGGFLETGLGTRFRLLVLDPLPPSGPDPATPAGRRAARATTDALRAALGPAVAELEAATRTENGRRPLPGLRRLFH
ncbi:MAG: 1-acyl-sn-glycerol-3-phosphate acyltransferase [Chloroflexota bacterium]